MQDCPHTARPPGAGPRMPLPEAPPVSRILLALLMPALAAGTAGASGAEIPMEWVIEGRPVAAGDPTAGREAPPGEVPVAAGAGEEPAYDGFVTGNRYFVGGREIEFYSEEGQELNALLVGQLEAARENLMHKIKYYDRFSDGYVEIAEALLDPIGDNTYIIHGRKYDHNPNSNLEVFVRERGYSLDDLAAIPNDVFSPKRFTLGRAMMEEAARTGDGEFDLRKYSPNYLDLGGEDARQSMAESLEGQALDLFGRMVPGSTADPGRIGQDARDAQPPDAGPPEAPALPELRARTFEGTGHVRDLLGRAPPEPPAPQGGDPLVFLLVPAAAALAALGYLARGRLGRGGGEPTPPAAVPGEDYALAVRRMLAESRALHESGRHKEAYEALGRSIRYYYSQRLGVFREMTNLEIFSELGGRGAGELPLVREWLLLCGSVDYAMYAASPGDFEAALSGFGRVVEGGGARRA